MMQKTQQKRRPVRKRPKPQRAKAFHFQLGWSGVAGIFVVGCCLLFWMFLLGIWAGQKILLPPSPLSDTFKTTTVQEKEENRSGVENLLARSIEPLPQALEPLTPPSLPASGMQREAVQAIEPRRTLTPAQTVSQTPLQQVHITPLGIKKRSSE